MAGGYRGKILSVKLSSDPGLHNDSAVENPGAGYQYRPTEPAVAPGAGLNDVAVGFGVEA